MCKSLEKAVVVRVGSLIGCSSRGLLLLAAVACCTGGFGTAAKGGDILRTIEGAEKFGWDLANAGDIDGDGIPDVVIGSQLEQIVYVYSGSDGTLLCTCEIAETAHHGDFGHSVAGGGDVYPLDPFPDGIPDILVGAPGNDIPPPSDPEACNDPETQCPNPQSNCWCGAGQAFVFSGADCTGGGVISPVLVLDGTAEGSDHKKDSFGRSVAFAGNLDGNPGDELLIGAGGYGGGPVNSIGRVFLFSESGAPITFWDPPPGTGNASFGVAVASVGDVDLDGFPDIVIGAQQETTEDQMHRGVAHLFSGKAPYAELTRWEGEGANFDTALGASVAAAGDVNMDGIPDVLIGSPGYGIFEGRVYVFSGAPPYAAIHIVIDDFIGLGGANTLAGVGDVNGDGHADFLVGAPSWDVVPFGNEGKATVYSGASGLPLCSLVGDPLTGDWHLGSSVTGAGDINGDGIPDVYIGVPLALGGNPPGDPHVHAFTCEIAPYIVHGNPDWDRNDPLTWVSFNDWAFGGYIDPKVESTDAVNLDLGLDTFEVVFSEEVFGDAVRGSVTTANVTVEQTGGTAPNVSTVTKNVDTLTVVLDRILTLQEWTTLVFDVWNFDGVRIVDNGNEGPVIDEKARLDVGFLPADVNNDGVTQPLDHSRWIVSWNGGDPIHPVDVEKGTPADYLDISRNGLVEPVDLSRMLAALKGQYPFTLNWRNVGMNNVRP